MHKEMGGEEKEGSCVIIPSCVAVAAEEELAPLLLCWLLGEDAGRMEHLGMGVGGSQPWGKMVPTHAGATDLV